MRATFLDAMPLSGDYPERSYQPTLDCGWVLFEPPSEAAWVGAFGRGSFGCRQVLRCGETSVVLVLADGEPYLVNGETGELVSESISGEIMTAVSVPERDLVIAADNSSLVAIDSRGLVWKSPLVAIDGIDLLETTSAEMKGHLHTEDGVRPFSLRFRDWRLVEGESRGW
jgi:hypothetical protein